MGNFDERRHIVLSAQLMGNKTLKQDGTVYRGHAKSAFISPAGARADVLRIWHTPA